MKTKDIRVGEEYAIRPGVRYSSDCKRARVLEVGAKRLVWRHEPYHNGVRVVYLDRDTGTEMNNISDTMLLAKDIVVLWSTYVPQLEENRKAKAEGVRRRAALKDAAQSRVDELLAFGVKSAKLDFANAVRADPVECLDAMRVMKRAMDRLMDEHREEC